MSPVRSSLAWGRAKRCLSRFGGCLSDLGIGSCVLIALLSLFFAGTGVFGAIGWNLYLSGTLSFDAQLAQRLAGGIAPALIVALLCFAALVVVFSQVKARTSSGADALSISAKGQEAARVSSESGRPAAVGGRSGAIGAQPFFVGAFDALHVLRCGVLVLVCWIPYLVVFAPGILTYDSLWSILQSLGSGALPMISPLDDAGAFSAHKPIVHTWLLGAFVLAGDALGSQSAGVLAFTVVQAAATALSLGASCCYLARIGAPLIARRAALVFCALFPFIPIYALSCFNDSMFSWLYVLWFICIAEIVRTRAATLRAPRFVVLVSCLGICLAVTKNPGVYLVAATILILAVVYRRELASWRVAAGMAAALLAPVLIALVIMPRVVYPLAGVVGSSSNEALGTLYQTTAAYVASHGDEVTEEERASIDAVLDYDRLAEAYDPVTQDPVKTLQRTDVDAAALLDYLASWARMGLKHPDTYLVAAAIVPLPFFCPAAEFTYYDDAQPKDVAYYLETMPQDTEEQKAALARLSIEADPAKDGAKNLLRSALDGLHGLPVVGAIFGLGFWATWVPLLFVVGVGVAHRRWLPLCVPVALSVALLLISPWAMARYALPLVYTAPLLWGVLVSGELGAREKQGKKDADGLLQNR